MKTLALLLLACSAKVGWADDFYLFNSTVGQTQNSLKLPDGAYVVNNGSTLTLIIPPAHGGGGDGPEPYWISHGTWTTTLDDFMKSGKFCEQNEGHLWVCLSDFQNSFPLRIRMKKKWAVNPWPCGDNEDRCLICDRCRRRIKIQKEELIWEP